MSVRDTKVVPIPAESDDKLSEDNGQDAFEALNEAKTSKFHFKSIIIAGSGFFTDAYDLFSIGLLTKLLGRIYYQSYKFDNGKDGVFSPTSAAFDDPFWNSFYLDRASPALQYSRRMQYGFNTNGTNNLANVFNPPKLGPYAGEGKAWGLSALPIQINAAVSGVALCGTLAGQLFFGWAGDKFGRKKVYGITLMLMIISSVGSSLSFGHSASQVMGTLCWWRFWLGFGVGGDYPLSATIMSEYSSRSNRGAFVAAVFAMQGIGILVAAVITLVVTQIFRQAHIHNLIPYSSPIQFDKVTGWYFNASQNVLTGRDGTGSDRSVYFMPTTDGIFAMDKKTGLPLDPTLQHKPWKPWKIPGVPDRYYDLPGGGVLDILAHVTGGNATFAPGNDGWFPRKSNFNDYQLPKFVFEAFGMSPQNPANTLGQPQVPQNGFSVQAAVLAKTYATKAVYGIANTYDVDAAQHKVKRLFQMSVPPQADCVWRIVLLLACLPAIFTLYSRILMPETARYKALVQGNVEKATADMEKVLGKKLDAKLHHVHAENISTAAFLKRHGLQLLGCCLTWMLLDVAFYSQGLFQKDVFVQVGFVPPGSVLSALDETFLIARAQAIIALSSTIPGYWVTVFTIERLGRWNIQMLGFTAMTALMAGLAGGYFELIKRHSHGADFIVLYCLTFFFANWGPNATTFVIPAELFPASWRSTAHGIAAASGKAGAIVGAFGFLYSAQPAKGDYKWDPSKPGCGYVDKLNAYVKNTLCGGPAPLIKSFYGAAASCDATKTWTCTLGDPYNKKQPNFPDHDAPYGIGLRKSLGILAAINFAGMCFTFLVPETKNKSLEENSGEFHSVKSMQRLRGEDPESGSDNADK